MENTQELCKICEFSIYKKRIAHLSGTPDSPMIEQSVSIDITGFSHAVIMIYKGPQNTPPVPFKTYEKKQFSDVKQGER